VIRRHLDNAWYGDCRLDQQLAYLVNVPGVGWRVQVNDQQLLPLDSRNLPLYLRVTDTGPLKLAGQGNESGWAVQYDDSGWTVPYYATYGINPLIYVGQELVLSTVAMGSQGFRYVGDSGEVITGDQTVNHGTAWAQACGVIGPLWEWSHFGDLTIGQGDTGCIAEWQGKRYVLSTGQVYFIRVRRSGTTVCVYLVKPGYAEALWFDVSELGGADFPLEAVPVPPEPPKPEPPKPPDPKPPKPPMPTPVPPLPPLKTSERYWLHPNIDSDVPAAIHGDLATVDVFGLYVQWILEDARYGQVDTLSGIRQQGVNLGIEMGSIKPGDWHAENAIRDLPTVAQRVLAKGHRVCYLTMDEPLTAAKQRPEQPFDESVFAVVKFVEAARAAMPGVKVVWAEACPEIDLETQRKFLMGLDSWGCHLDGWHIDMDWHRAGTDAYDIIRTAKQYADDYKVPLGVYLVGYSHLTDDAYFSEVIVMATDLCSEASWCIDHVLVQAWAARTGTEKQDLPANFGEDGLFDLFGHVQEDIFQ
jgi:hypothetical protein